MGTSRKLHGAVSDQAHTAERVERFGAHVGRYWAAIDSAEEQAQLSDIVTDNALTALLEGDTAEASVWCSLGELRSALRAKAWR